MSSTEVEQLAAVWEALEAGRLEAAWQAAEPLRGQLGREAGVARVWLRLLEQTPERESRLGELREVLAGFSGEAELLLGVTGLLLREDEPAPLDEPRAEDGPAALAAGALRRWLEGARQEDTEEARALRALLWVRLGSCLRLLGPERQSEAWEAFERGLALGPGNPEAWYDAGLGHKYAGRFEAGVVACRTALEGMPWHEGAWWNLGLCASGAGDVASALEAWRHLGLQAREGEAGRARVDGLGRVQVRLSSGGPAAQGGLAPPGARFAYESVWVEAHSPCHGVLLTAPARVQGVAVGDVVLWDVAPLSVSEVEGRHVPCFPLLAVLEKRGRA
jgi:tetratricopeptide (TPR) repeat protein